MNIKTIAFSVLKPVLVDWLKTRALVLPNDKVIELSKRLEVPIVVVLALQEQYQAQALEELEKLGNKL